MDEDRPDASAAATQDLLRELADRDEALIEMARLAVTRREQLEVSSDARRLLSDRRRESNRLVGALRGEYRIPYQPSIPERLQPLLDSLNGVGMGEFDRTFLRIVAEQYEDDAKLIDRGLRDVAAPAVREMLAEIRAQRSNDAAAFHKRLASGSS